jgi:hypothetical protein
MRWHLSEGTQLTLTKTARSRAVDTRIRQTGAGNADEDLTPFGECLIGDESARVHAIRCPVLRADFLDPRPLFSPARVQASSIETTTMPLLPVKSASPPMQVLICGNTLPSVALFCPLVCGRARCNSRLSYTAPLTALDQAEKKANNYRLPSTPSYAA